MIEKTQTFQCILCNVCLLSFFSLFFFFFSQARFATVTLQCTCHFCLFSSLARLATLQCTCHVSFFLPGQVYNASAHMSYGSYLARFATLQCTYCACPFSSLARFATLQCTCHVCPVLPGQVCNTSVHMSCVSFSSLPRFADSGQVSGGDPGVCDDSPTRGWLLLHRGRGWGDEDRSQSTQGSQGWWIHFWISWCVRYLPVVWDAFLSWEIFSCHVRCLPVMWDGFLSCEMSSCHV